MSEVVKLILYAIIGFIGGYAGAYLVDELFSSKGRKPRRGRK